MCNCVAAWFPSSEVSLSDISRYIGGYISASQRTAALRARYANRLSQPREQWRYSKRPTTSQRHVDGVAGIPRSGSLLSGALLQLPFGSYPFSACWQLTTDFAEHTCSLEGLNYWKNCTVIQWYRPGKKWLKSVSYLFFLNVCRHVNVINKGKNDDDDDDDDCSWMGLVAWIEHKRIDFD